MVILLGGKSHGVAVVVTRNAFEKTGYLSHMQSWK